MKKKINKIKERVSELNCNISKLKEQKRINESFIQGRLYEIDLALDRQGTISNDIANIELKKIEEFKKLAE